MMRGYRDRNHLNDDVYSSLYDDSIVKLKHFLTELYKYRPAEENLRDGTIIIEDVNRKINLNNIDDANKMNSVVDPVVLYESRIRNLENCLDKTKKESKNFETLKFPEEKLNSQFGQRKQINILQRENNEMANIIIHLQVTIGTLREKEMELTKKLRRYQNDAEEMRFEKLQAEEEIRCLMTELDKLQVKHQKSLQEQHRIKQQSENQYGQQIEKLLADLQDQWDKHSQLSLQINRQKIIECELRDELSRKDNQSDDLKKELNEKISRLRNEIISMNAKKESLDYQLRDLKVQLEQADHNLKLAEGKYQQEITELTQRLNRTETELSHNHHENIRLHEQISSLQKQLRLTTLTKEELTNQNIKIEQDLTNMMLDMDSKRGRRISDLENMIQSQSKVTNHLKYECKILLEKLAEESTKHKETIARLENNLEYLNTKLNYTTIHTENDWNDEESNYQILNPDNSNS